MDLKVDRLRYLLAKRGLSTAGTKSTLVKRLEAAIQEDTDGDSSTKRKRPRDSDGHRKIKTTDELASMSVKQLHEEAEFRGISATGTKRQLLQMLCADADHHPTDDDQAPEDSKQTKTVTAVKKGSAVLDQWLPDHIKAQFHVLQVSGEIYDAMLNQTNVGDNNNKFYVIQVLESDAAVQFMVYSRWGRVGVKGQDKLSGPYNSQHTAISEFEKKFFDKTKNYWSNRKDFVHHQKCYTWLEMDYSKTENEHVGSERKQESTSKTETRESKLEPCVAKFISLICNTDMMKQQMIEIGYNAEKLPLGKLSKSTILKGYDVLKRIADVIGQADRKTLEQLSGEFYSVIPHDFGFKNMSLFIIDTPQKLKSKLEMVEALGEIEVATKLLKDGIDTEDPLDSQYRRLHCELTPLEVNSEEYAMIKKYTVNTHAKTHENYAIDIVQIFRVSREGEAERFKKFAETKNRMLLWHGSRLTNWTGILSQGLRIAPPEAPSTGYMFGKGVYFADMFSKSANYCCAYSNSPSGVLLLCEVALGDMAELLAANYDANILPPGKLSTKGVGGTAPDIREAQTLEDGVVVPLGKPKKQPGPKVSLLYNEYIVYNVEQIKMRYVVHVNFKF